MNNLTTGLLGSRPMILVIAAFIIGILIENIIQFDIFLIIVFLLLIALGLGRYINWTSLSVTLILIVCSGVLRMAIDREQPRSSLQHYEAKKDSVYRIVATVTGVGETRKGTPKYLLTPQRINSRHIAGGKMILYAKELAVEPEIGDTLVGNMVINQPRSKRNPNDFNYRKYLRNKEIFYEGFIHDPGKVEVFPLKVMTTSKILQKLRLFIKDHFHRYLSPNSAAIMSALILGERGEVDDQTKADFANTGVIHVLAVSGLHVGYVSLILMTVIGLFRLPYRLQSTLVILGLGGYVLLTGGAASVMRASIMAALILIGGLIERKPEIINILAAAALIILLIDPSQLDNIGFQLSFLAVFSIVLLFPALREYMPRYKSRYKFLESSVNAIVDLFLVSMAAQLGTLAITIYYFNKIPVVSLLANLVVVPLIGMIVATGMTSLLLGSIFPALAQLWANLLDLLIDLMLLFVSQCAQLSWAFISIRRINLLEVALILSGVFTIAFKPLSRFPAILAILILLWGNSLVWKDILWPERLELIVLDVGQGDAIIVHTLNDETIVIDAGLKFSGKDMGLDVISPYLIYRNWETIDLLVLTHPHNDHNGGANYLINHHPVKRVLMQDIHYNSYGYRKLRRTLDSLHIPTDQAMAGLMDSTFAPLYFRVTGPRYFSRRTVPANVNNISIVLQMFYGHTSLLLTGDAEADVENDQLAYGSLLRSDIIKAPHHGSRTSSTEPYLEFVHPEICLISLGLNNKYRHPAPETLKKYAALGTVVHRTDLEGALIYSNDGKSWRYQPWKSGSKPSMD